MIDYKAEVLTYIDDCIKGHCKPMEGITFSQPYGEQTMIYFDLQMVFCIGSETDPGAIIWKMAYLFLRIDYWTETRAGLVSLGLWDIYCFLCSVPGSDFTELEAYGFTCLIDDIFIEGQAHKVWMWKYAEDDDDDGDIDLGEVNLNAPNFLATLCAAFPHETLRKHRESMLAP